MTQSPKNRLTSQIFLIEVGARNRPSVTRRSRLRPYEDSRGQNGYRYGLRSQTPDRYSFRLGSLCVRSRLECLYVGTRCYRAAAKFDEELARIPKSYEAQADRMGAIWRCLSIANLRLTRMNLQTRREV